MGIMGKIENRKLLLKLAEEYPTLSELRVHGSHLAPIFLERTRSFSDNWPTKGVIDKLLGPRDEVAGSFWGKLIQFLFYRYPR